MKRLYNLVDDFKDAILTEDYSKGQKTIITIEEDKSSEVGVKVTFERETNG